MSYMLCHKHSVGEYEWKETEIQLRKEEESKESYKVKKGHESI